MWDCSARRSWLASIVGLFTMFVHLHVLLGAFDVNSQHGPVLPYLRSIDGLNTHDAAFELAIAGGVTSVQVFIFRFYQTSASDWNTVALAWLAELVSWTINSLTQYTQAAAMRLAGRPL
jgi:hypothetical protein